MENKRPPALLKFTLCSPGKRIYASEDDFRVNFVFLHLQE